MITKTNCIIPKIAATTLSACLASASYAQDRPPSTDITEIEYILCETDGLGSILFSVYPNKNQQEVESEYITNTTGGMTFATNKTEDGFFTNLDLPVNSMLKFNYSRIISVFEDEVDTGSCSNVTETIQPVTIRVLEAQTGENIQALKQRVAELGAEKVQQRRQFEEEKNELQDSMESQQADLARSNARWKAAGAALDDATLLLGSNHSKELSQKVSECWNPNSLTGQASDESIKIKTRTSRNGTLSRSPYHIEFIPSKSSYPTTSTREIELALLKCQINLNDFALPSYVHVVLNFSKEGVTVPSSVQTKGSSELPLRLRRFLGRGGLTRARRRIWRRFPGIGRPERPKSASEGRFRLMPAASFGRGTGCRGRTG